jgi:hypothetical protein
MLTRHCSIAAAAGSSAEEKGEHDAVQPEDRTQRGVVKRRLHAARLAHDVDQRARQQRHAPRAPCQHGPQLRREVFEQIEKHNTASWMTASTGGRAAVK